MILQGERQNLISWAAPRNKLGEGASIWSREEAWRVTELRAKRPHLNPHEGKVSQQQDPGWTFSARARWRMRGSAAAARAESESSVSFQARRIQTTATVNTASAASPHWTPRDGLDTTQESPDPCPPQWKSARKQKMLHGSEVSMFFSLSLQGCQP